MRLLKIDDGDENVYIDAKTLSEASVSAIWPVGGLRCAQSVSMGGND